MKLLNGRNFDLHFDIKNLLDLATKIKHFQDPKEMMDLMMGEIRLLHKENRLLVKQQNKLKETAGYVKRAWEHDRPHMNWSVAQLQKAVEATENDCKY